VQVFSRKAASLLDNKLWNSMAIQGSRTGRHLDKWQHWQYIYDENNEYRIVWSGAEGLSSLRGRFFYASLLDNKLLNSMAIQGSRTGRHLDKWQHWQYRYDENNEYRVAWSSAEGLKLTEKQFEMWCWRKMHHGQNTRAVNQYWLN